MPKPRKAAVGAEEPILTCPFTGEPVELVYSDTLLMHAIRGPFYQTRWYNSRQALLYDFSTRNGVQPQFKVMKVQVIGLREPPPQNPVAHMHRPLSDEVKGKIGEIVDKAYKVK